MKVGDAKKKREDRDEESIQSIDLIEKNGLNLETPSMMPNVQTIKTGLKSIYLVYVTWEFTLWRKKRHTHRKVNERWPELVVYNDRQMNESIERNFRHEKNEIKLTETWIASPAKRADDMAENNRLPPPKVILCPAEYKEENEKIKIW